MSVGGRLLDTHDDSDPAGAEGVPGLPDELTLIRRAQSGDASAYEVLVRRYQDIAFRTAYLITGDAGDAEDAAQAGFLNAWRALHRFEPDPARRPILRRRSTITESSSPQTPFRPWILQIVANEARNRRAARGRHPTLALSAVEDRPADEPARSPEAAALAVERDTALLDALNALSPEDRLVISCRYVLDLSEAETAAAISIPRGTVKSRLYRALRRARALLEEGGTTDD